MKQMMRAARHRETGTFLAVLVLASLAGCTTLEQRQTDATEWSRNPAVEVAKYYQSGKSVEHYLNGKKVSGSSDMYSHILCQGFIQVSDQARTDQCMKWYTVKFEEEKEAWKPYVQRGGSTELLNLPIRYNHEMLNILYNNFLVEQGRFKEVNDKLMPYMAPQRPKYGLDFLKREAAYILAKAQRNLGGIDPAVKQVIEEAHTRSLKYALTPRAAAVKRAHKSFLLGEYEACYQEVLRSKSENPDLDTGFIASFGSVVDVMYGGEFGAIEDNIKVEFFRLQGLCAYESGRIAEVRQPYLDLLKLDDARNMMGLQRIANYHLGRIALQQGDNSAAVNYLKAAITALEAERAAIDSEAGRLGYVTNKSEIYALLIEQLIVAGHDAEAFDYAERAKSRALIDMLGTKLQKEKQGESRGTFTQALHSLRENESSDLSLALGAKAGGTSRSASFKQNLIRTNPNLGSLLSVSSLPVKDVQSRLTPQETLIEYFGEGDRLFAFVVTRNRVKAVRIDAREAQAAAMSFRAALTNPDDKSYRNKGKRLFDLIVAPALPFADKGPLTIVPHGALHYIPFAALYDGKSYLVNHADLRILPSASVLQFLNKNSASAKGGLLVLGNPDLGDRSLDLPGAQEEAAELSRIDHDAKLLLRKQASETALRKLGPQHRDIHFAMHGKFDSKDPLSSGLYMSADADNDGVLTVGELYDLQLDADLVVLSACETALGDASKGDDVVGLNRGFLYAGANSIVSSLWEVDDKATRDLMVSFYQNRKQAGKAAALRRAQLKIIDKYPHPYYWAAFQINGTY